MEFCVAALEDALTRAVNTDQGAHSPTMTSPTSSSRGKA
jgi:hypothetical protein